MTGIMRSALGGKLKRILKVEGEMLHSGNAQDAVLLIEEKMSAMNELEVSLEALGQRNVSVSERREIEQIVQLAEVNSVHFQAIRNGIRHAISRLEGLQGNAYVGSYGQDGGKVAFPQATGRYMNKS